MSISPIEFRMMMIRQQPKGLSIEPPKDGCSVESELHADIEGYCKAKGWLWFKSPMHERTNRRAGEPDYTILLDSGRVKFIEAKTAKGKLSTEQLGMQKWASMLGHTIYVVRSFKEFLEVVQ